MTQKALARYLESKVPEPVPVDPVKVLAEALAQASVPIRNQYGAAVAHQPPTAEAILAAMPDYTIVRKP